MLVGTWSAPDTTAVPAFLAAVNSAAASAGRDGRQVTAPPGCTDPDRWMDAYLIAEAHRSENGVCRCGRPLPCIAAQRAEDIMAETTAAARAANEAARAAEAAAEAQRQFMRTITQELPIVRVEPEKSAAPVGARFARPRRDDDEPPAASSGFVVPEPRPSPPPTGARFYRERKPPRHRG